MNRLLVVGILSLILTSCASYFTRKDCEKQNWYQVGYDAAMRGDRISNDETVSKCRKADAEISDQQLDTGWKAGASRYCQPDAVFQTGKNGDLFNTDYCEEGQLGLLRKKHADGLIAYCQDGLAAGLSGKKYKNVCSGTSEKNFLPGYRQGRKRYLSSMTSTAESKRREVTMDLDKLEYQKRINDNRMSVLPSARVGDKDPYDEERRNLNNRSWSLANEISQKNALKSQLDKEIDNYRQELATLN